MDQPIFTRGDPSINHCSEETFAATFFGVQLAFTIAQLPGRFFGTEVRQGRWNPDYVSAVTDEAARRREVRQGKMPTSLVVAPDLYVDSWEHMWYKEMHKRRWKVHRAVGQLSPV